MFDTIIAVHCDGCGHGRCCALVRNLGRPCGWYCQRCVFDLDPLTRLDAVTREAILTMYQLAERRFPSCAAAEAEYHERTGTALLAGVLSAPAWRGVDV